MASMPDFIQDFFDEVHDEKASKELLKLSTEFNQKWGDLQRAKNSQHTNADMAKTFGIKPPKIDFVALEKSLKNEYKEKAAKIAKPHMDADRHSELAKKHAPEFMPEADRTMRHLGETQEKMLERKKEFQEKEQAKKEAKEETKEETLEERRARIKKEITDELEKGKGKDKKHDTAIDFYINKVDTDTDLTKEERRQQIRKEIEAEQKQRNSQQRERDR
ncbi:hypothetical protein JMG10_03430 [Nostoc ellipsosporum NOK]|nr:hypothetical protein [Nostoc ellipsosporum NOK]